MLQIYNSKLLQTLKKSTKNTFYVKENSVIIYLKLTEINIICSNIINTLKKHEKL